MITGIILAQESDLVVTASPLHAFDGLFPAPGSDLTEEDPDTLPLSFLVPLGVPLRTAPVGPAFFREREW
jgi:hypothetical protein